MPAKINRREFIKWGGTGLAAAAAAAIFHKRDFFRQMLPPMNMPLGHRLWKKDFPEPTVFRQIDVVLVGGGMSALSAAWYFSRKLPHVAFEMHELEPEVGGNSSWGENAVSAYPWGAHYVPFANAETTHLREIFEDLGVITHYEKGEAFYHEDYVCHDPEERLLFRGAWIEGLVPTTGVSADELAEIKRFFSFTHELRDRKGKDGKPLFAIPLELSSADPEIRALDKKSFAEFLEEQNFKSPVLRWYMDYCCKDDFGALAKDVSAWAGLHYFSSRRGKAANGGNASLVTWPQGNGWIAQQLKKRCGERIYSHSLVYDVKNVDDQVKVYVYDPDKDVSSEITARTAIVATPLYVTAKIVSEMEGLWKEHQEKFHHSPWLIGNVTLEKIPPSRGFPLAWDNVSYYSDSIGYVVATHQEASVEGPIVITLYHPFTEVDSSFERHRLLLASQSTFEDQIRKDLMTMHPGIEKYIREIKTKIWGHGMIRPSVNFMWSGLREKFAQPLGRIHLAHTDLSGISIFEEASYQGIKAAEACSKLLG